MIEPVQQGNVYIPQGPIERDVVERSYDGAIIAGQKAAREQLERYQAAYSGKFNITLPVKIAFEIRGFGIRTNLAKPIIDGMCAKLDLRAVTSTDKEQQRILDEEYERNEMDEQSPAIHKEVAVSGDAYVLVQPEIGPDRKPTHHASIRLLQTEDVDLRYDEHDLLKPTKCIRQWNEFGLDGKPRVRRDIIMAEQIEREYSSAATDSQWMGFTEDGLPSVIPNDMHCIPIVHFKTELDLRNKPFGMSQLEPALPILKDIQEIIKEGDIGTYYASGRQLVVAGVNKEVFDKKNPAGLDRSAYAAHMWTDPNTKEWAIAGDNMAGIIAWLDIRVKHLAIVTRTPLEYLEAGLGTQRGSMSGTALQELQMTLEDKVKEAQTMLGSAYRRLFSLTLQACGVTNPTVDVAWEQPYQQDTTVTDQEEYKLGLITAKEYHMRRGMTDEAATKLAADLAQERAAETQALFKKNLPGA